MTTRDATAAWVSTFSCVPYRTATRLQGAMREITPIRVGSRVVVSNAGSGEVQELADGVYTVELDSERIVSVPASELILEDIVIPMNGYLYAFDTGVDREWLSTPTGLQAMADCGFHIYEQPDYRFLFGLEGVGYDYYQAHWIPLYLARFKGGCGS